MIFFANVCWKWTKMNDYNTFKSYKKGLKSKNGLCFKNVCDHNNLKDRQFSDFQTFAIKRLSFCVKPTLCLFFPTMIIKHIKHNKHVFLWYKLHIASVIFDNLLFIKLCVQHSMIDSHKHTRQYNPAPLLQVFKHMSL